jgi:5-methylcytosine-specific restriction endonuclease McrA
MQLNAHPALVLNADYRPLSYYPLSVWNWQDAMKAVFLGRVTIAAEYDATVRTPSRDVRLPAVIVLNRYCKQPERPTLTRMNVWLRDEGRCLYCDTALASGDLTFDHVIPRSRNGGSDWANIACACFDCNGKKAARTPKEAGMALLRIPKEPTRMQLAVSARKLGKAIPIREEWDDFVYWEGELERS